MRGTHSRGLLICLALCGMALSSLSACTVTERLTDGPGSRGGPVKVSNPAVYLTEFEQGREFGDAFVQVKLSGEAAGVLQGVELLGGDGYFEVVGLKVAGPKRRFGSFQMTQHFPPKNPALGPVADGAGAELVTGDVGTLMLVGLRVAGDGIGSRTGLRVHYSVDGEEYYQDLGAAIVNCPPGTTEKACDVAFDQGLEDAQELVD